MTKYTTYDASNNTVEITELFRVNSIDGIDFKNNELFCTGLTPDGFRMRGLGPQWVHPVPVKLQKFSRINPNTLIPEYEPEMTINGEVHKMSALVEHTKEVGPDSPMSDIKVKFLNANAASSFSGFNATLKDRLHGQLFPGLYQVNLVLEDWTKGDEDAEEPGCIDKDNTIPLPYEHIDPTDQYETQLASKKVGDAKLVLRRDRLNNEQINHLQNQSETKRSYITICVDGGPEIRYTIWNGQGIRRKQTYFLELMLKREQQNN